MICFGFARFEFGFAISIPEDVRAVGVPVDHCLDGIVVETAASSGIRETFASGLGKTGVGTSCVD